MNILIPHTWLLEHLETEASPQDIQRLVSLSGPSVERIYDRLGESVYDIEVTTNRVDSMSVRGIAREAAVILNHAGIPAKLKPLQLSVTDAHGRQLQLPKIVNNEHLCSRVLCVVLSDVQRVATPDWMAQRLEYTDQHVHDAAIDITNYVTHELGHPCHAFDYDKIMSLGGEIIITEAQKGKKFITLDGGEYTTVGGEIVFENQHGEIIDLPAIKGTKNTSVDESTKNILFWIESIDPKKVRFASMTHAIRTVAAQLNEKNVDPELAMNVLLRGIELYTSLCHATVASEIHDEYPSKRTLHSIEVPLGTIKRYLGIELPEKTVQSILEELGCDVTLTTHNSQPTTVVVTPPSFRPDLTIPADIVEEIARIYGYHNLPSTIMDTPIPMIKPEGVDFDIEYRVKQFLADIGWTEVYTYSMVSEKIAVESGYTLQEHVTIQNPLTDDRVYLRNSLIPSLNEVIDNNSVPDESSIFEMAHVYHAQPQTLPIEMLLISMVSTKSYRAVKGDLEALLRQFFITKLTLTTNDPQLPYVSQSAILSTTIEGKEVELGTIVVMHNGRIAVTLGLMNLIAVAQKHPTYVPSPKTAQIIEDLTFTVKEKTAVGEVIASITALSPFIRQVQLKDVYKQNYSFTVSYQDVTKNLTKEDVEPLRKQIVMTLQEKYQAALVGEI